MSKLTKAQMHELWEKQNDIAQKFAAHVVAELKSTIGEDTMSFLFSLNDNVPARNLFTEADKEMVQVAVDALVIAARFDDFACAMPKSELETLLDSR